MSDNTEKNIEDIRVGMKVFSYSKDKNQLIPSEVKNIYISNYNDTVYKILLSNGEFIFITEYHPLVTNMGYKTVKAFDSFTVKYDSICVGDKVLYKDLDFYDVVEIIPYKHYKTVYNLLVDDDNYIANGMVISDEDLEGFIRSNSKTKITIDSATNSGTCSSCSSNLSLSTCSNCNDLLSGSSCLGSVSAGQLCVK